MSSATVILPSSYLAPISYYHSILKQDNAIFDYAEHFVTRTFRNRCEIYGANGSLNLSIPVQKITGKSSVKDIKVSYDMDWQAVHWKSMETAYKSSPFFEFYEHYFHNAFNTKIEYLVDLNTELFEITLKILDLAKEIEVSQKYLDADEKSLDLRAQFNLRKKPNFHNKPYFQVFSDTGPFLEDLSIIDLIFNLGPEAGIYLKNCTD
ncbi:MAG: WbqC family protein [Flavobacteriales bacterium]|nr:WbqC family protein [Flavobacteriales bacterium]